LDSRGAILDGSNHLSATRISPTETFEIKVVPMMCPRFGSKSIRLEFQGGRISDLERHFSSGDGPDDRAKHQFSSASRVFKPEDLIPPDSFPGNRICVSTVPISGCPGTGAHWNSPIGVPQPAQVPLCGISTYAAMADSELEFMASEKGRCKTAHQLEEEVNFSFQSSANDFVLRSRSVCECRCSFLNPKAETIDRKYLWQFPRTAM
jgi:hypothetical protein